jgi:hypothetical protein
MQRSPKDVLAGLTFVGFGLAFAAGAATYEIGSPVRMGPGFYPLLVAILLVALGGAILIRPALQDAGDAAEPLTAPAWRAVPLILGAVILFGLTARGLGLIPAIFITSSLSALASHRTNILLALILGAALTALSVAIFVLALRLNLPLLGPWIPKL